MGISKRRKYGNIKVEIDGHQFDSRHEANYYGKLKLLKKAGEVLDFSLQPKYNLVVNGINLGFYKGDFLVSWKTGETQLIDAKGVKTPVYQLKKKLVKAIYDIDIHEV